ncbi:MAG: hypothetical protein WC068_02620 [Caulobacter sp.]
MATNNERGIRASPLGTLRRAGIGVATAEVAYLVCWMGVDLGLIGGASPVPLPQFGQAPPASLTGLILGMVWTAAFGALAGLIADACLNLMDRPTPFLANRQTFARLLRVRNHTR